MGQCLVHITLLAQQIHEVSRSLILKMEDGFPFASSFISSTPITSSLLLQCRLQSNFLWFLSGSPQDLGMFACIKHALSMTGLLKNPSQQQHPNAHLEGIHEQIKGSIANLQFLLNSTLHFVMQTQTRQLHVRAA